MDMLLRIPEARISHSRHDESRAGQSRKAHVPTENSVLVYSQGFTCNCKLSENYLKWYHNQRESVKMGICKVLFLLFRGNKDFTI